MGCAVRVAIVGFYHETNTFALEHNDQFDAYAELGDELVHQAHPRSYIGGFLEGMQGSDVELVPIANVRFRHGGLIHSDVYEHYRHLIVDGLRGSGPLNGVFFALHGAMAAEDPYTDAEGGLLQSVRDVLPDAPFVATYDFHGIMTIRNVRSSPRLSRTTPILISTATSAVSKPRPRC